MSELDRNGNDNSGQMMLIAVLAIAAKWPKPQPVSGILLRLKSNHAGGKVRRMMECRVAQIRIERHISTFQGDIK